jgi:hypothetical protein
MMVNEMSLKKRWVELQCRGYTHDRIAEETNSDPAWVRHFLRANNLKALKKMVDMRAAERAKQVRILEHMIQEASLAWQRSCLAEESIDVIEEPTPGMATQVNPPPAPGSFSQVQQPMSMIRTKRSTRYQCGNVAYLKAMQGFMQDIRSILKIDDGTKRIDFSLNIPGRDSVEGSVNVQEMASQQLQEWNAQQKERLQRMLELPVPEIVNPNSPDPEIRETPDGEEF